MRTCVREYQGVAVRRFRRAVETHDDHGRFDRAIVRWHARLCLDADGLDRLTA
jgi:hypothetical protein